MRLFLELIKFGIIIFVLFSGTAGYLLGQPSTEFFNWSHFALTLLSLFGYSAGSFALNQYQEVEIDSKMPRTEHRPIPSGKLSKKAALFLGIALIIVGVTSGFLVNELVGLLGLITVVLYNGFYTLVWKRRWIFGAIPGAIPGAMPVVIGYAAHTHELWRPELLYAFGIMFLWQMPHYWSLALRYAEDYKSAGIPVLPVSLGSDRTLYFIGIYTFGYVGLAIASPWIVFSKWAYLFLVLPMSAKVLFEFFKFFASRESKSWLRFFLWTTFSVLFFLIAPVFDRWYVYFFGY